VSPEQEAAKITVRLSDRRSFQAWLREQIGRYCANQGWPGRPISHPHHTSINTANVRLGDDLRSSVPRSLAALLAKQSSDPLEFLHDWFGDFEDRPVQDAEERMLESIKATVVHEGPEVATLAVFELRCEDCHAFIRPLAVRIEEQINLLYSAVCAGCHSVTVAWADDRVHVRLAPELERQDRLSSPTSREVRDHPMEKRELWRWVRKVQGHSRLALQIA